MGISPKVVNCKKDKYDIYIGRGSIWGNPFKIGDHGTREEVIAMYEGWLETGNNYTVEDATEEKRQMILAEIGALADKTLGCFCYPKACHGDVLLKLLNNKAAQGDQS